MPALQRLQEQPGVGGLLADPLGRDERLEGGQALGRQPRRGRLAQQIRPAPVRIERGLGQRQQLRAGSTVQHASAAGRGQRRPDIDQRLGGGGVARLGRAMDHGDLVVILQPARLVVREDPADALHAERLQLSRAQGAHAGGAEHVDAFRHGEQDLLVPDRRHFGEIAVDQADRPRPQLDRAGDVALGRRRQRPERRHQRRPLRGGQARPDEHQDGHGPRPLMTR